MGAPRYLKVCLMSMICSVAVFAATNSEPYVAVSTVACFFEYSQQEFYWQNEGIQLEIYQKLGNGSSQHPWW